jgi:oligopeptidase B
MTDAPPKAPRRKRVAPQIASTGVKPGAKTGDAGERGDAAQRAPAAKVTKASTRKKATGKPRRPVGAGAHETPPPARRKRVERVVHDELIHDDYAWLRAQNWRKVLRAPSALPRSIRAYLSQENAHTEAMLAPVRGLRRELIKEMRARIREDDSDPPTPDGPWSYYTRYRKGDEHPLVCRRPRDGGREAVMLDCEKLAGAKPFFDLESAAHAPSHDKLAWSVDLKGSEYYTIRVRDLANGRDLPDRIADTDGDVVWGGDSSAFLYVRVDENHRSCQIFRHRLGTDSSQDELILEELDARWFVRIGQTQSGDYATCEIEDHETSETWLLDLSDANATPRVVEPRHPNMQYEVEHHGDRLFILTNADGCEDFKIVEAPLATPGRAHWKDVVAHRKGRMITGFVVFARHLVRAEREDGLPRIVVREIATGQEHAIAFDEEAYDLDLDEVLEFDTDVIRFGYSSLKTPGEVWDYDMATRERRLVKRQEIPSGHDPDAYVTRRMLARSHDGALVPISILHRKDTPIDGSAPLLLEGYGAYGYAFEAHFSSSRLSLVDRGFVYAIAHVRGGTDKGWSWYLDGKLQNKPNSFHDFIACARALIEARYTSQRRIVALGGSAGGLLMGAVANMAPELFAGVIADVPFVDCLNTMLDDTLPLTPPEWLEWGNPITDRQAFRLIRSYSPYDNVRAQHYPAMLIEAGLTDPRVTYWEPAKWAARLRAEMTGGGPILLRTDMEAGHGGASGRFDRLKDIAVEYAFAIWAVGRETTS